MSKGNFNTKLIFFLLFELLFFSVIYFILENLQVINLFWYNFIFLIIINLYFYQRLNFSIKNKSKIKKFILYGAGDSGHEVLAKIPSQYVFMGFIDDNKVGYTKSGYPILGKFCDVEHILRKYSPDLLIVSFSNSDRSLILKLNDVCNIFGIELRILPIEFSGSSLVANFADATVPTVQDLFGRLAIDKNSLNISDEIQNKVVLVTGSGGSIGSELSRQLTRFNFKKLIALDRDENSLLRLQLSFNKSVDLSKIEFVLADIRDYSKIKDILILHTPDIIFHAAALKHVKFLETFPEEALKTNIYATRELLKLSASFGIPSFVNISSDKAVNPVNALGMSKLISERMVSEFGSSSNSRNRKYLSVRFGNVLGSSGSVVEIFNNQIEKGGPVTVTDPQVERFFMSIDEAVFLVIKSLVLGNNSEILVLDMGNQIKILELANKMISNSKTKIQIQFTGLANGEKLSESLHTENETLISLDSNISKINSDKSEILNSDQLINEFKRIYDLKEK